MEKDDNSKKEEYYSEKIKQIPNKIKNIGKTLFEKLKNLFLNNEKKNDELHLKRIKEHNQIMENLKEEFEKEIQKEKDNYKIEK